MTETNLERMDNAFNSLGFEIITFGELEDVGYTEETFNGLTLNFACRAVATILTNREVISDRALRFSDYCNTEWSVLIKTFVLDLIKKKKEDNKVLWGGDNEKMPNPKKQNNVSFGGSLE
jgi:hypothetical protein